MGRDEHWEELYTGKSCFVSLSLYNFWMFCEGCACHRGAAGPPEEVGWCEMEAPRLWIGPWFHHQLCALAWEDPALCFKGAGTDVV